MKKKNFLTFAALSIISAVGLLGACAYKETEKHINSSAANPADTDIADADMDIDSDIHYDVHSYEDLQSFSYNIFNEIIEEENPVLSPASAYLALSMAGFGADGNTRNEFNTVLGEDMKALSGNIMNRFPVSSDDMKISLANSAWIDHQYIVDENWLGTIQSVMGAEAFEAELSSIHAMDNINRWIEDKTNGLIEKMIEEPLDANSRLVLFNTLYFKGKWSSPFEQYMTIADTFNLADGNTVEVDMMRKYEEYLEYISNDSLEGVILPYKNVHEKDGANLAFVALKPKNSQNSIREMMIDTSRQNTAEPQTNKNGMTSEVISDLLSRRKTEMVNLKLPKFEITFDKVLNESLQNMGLTDCFDYKKADFSKMGKTESGENLYISLVRQKAKIIVDEEGTEAAAATEVAMAEGCALIEEEPIELFFDEPFLYLIMDIDKEIPLFIGIVDNPAV